MIYTILNWDVIFSLIAPVPHFSIHPPPWLTTCLTFILILAWLKYFRTCKSVSPTSTPTFINNRIIKYIYSIIVNLRCCERRLVHLKAPGVPALQRGLHAVNNSSPPPTTECEGHRGSNGDSLLTKVSINNTLLKVRMNCTGHNNDVSAAY